MLTVLKPGLYSTVQDEGRLEFLAFGMPQAGVMDRYSARMANLLCGNSLSAATVEMTLVGGAFRVERSCRVALCGADMSPHLNGTPIETWKAIELVTGDLLETGYAKSGCRAYLAVSGGVDVPVIMGSRSTYTRAGIGGVKGRPLIQGDVIPVGEAPPLQKKAPDKLESSLIPEFPEKINLRVLMGPQDDLFLPEGLEEFLQGEYIVSDESDRMGCRLEGPMIRHLDKADIISDALGKGAIQVPGNGQPIVMMSDCGTTGGYAKIATVIGADLCKLAQAKPQNIIRFSKCSEEEALNALRTEREMYLNAAKMTAAWQKTVQSKECNLKKMSLQLLNKTYQIEIEEVNMASTILLAKKYGIAVGAHPGFPDLVGFGRRAMALTTEEVKNTVIYQIGALEGFCRSFGITMQHVKAHGALYNMAEKDITIALAIADGIQAVNPSLYMLCLANSQMVVAAKKKGIPFVEEAFADRAYTDEGTLVSRKVTGSVIHEVGQVVDRVVRMVKDHTVISITGKEVPIEAQTICVHGDTPGAVEMIKALRGVLEKENIALRAFGI